MNKEEKREYQKKYHQANKEKLAAKRKAYYQANKEKCIAQMKVNQRRKPESIYIENGKIKKVL